VSKVLSIRNRPFWVLIEAYAAAAAAAKFASASQADVKGSPDASAIAAKIVGVVER
jgi:hypothetical protein